MTEKAYDNDLTDELHDLMDSAYADNGTAGQCIDIEQLQVTLKRGNTSCRMRTG